MTQTLAAWTRVHTWPIRPCVCVTDDNTDAGASVEHLAEGAPQGPSAGLKTSGNHLRLRLTACSGLDLLLSTGTLE